VALTRAQHRQYLAWGWVKDMQTAALSWLLHAQECPDLAACASWISPPPS
jgi:exodeoxyribonuclease V beta subunit